jgi:hypothetical protein
MGDFVTNSQTSLTQLYDQCNLLQNVQHDVLVLEVGDKIDQVRATTVDIARGASLGQRKQFLVLFISCGNELLVEYGSLITPTWSLVQQAFHESFDRSEPTGGTRRRHI